jgi:hypothetical protein
VNELVSSFRLRCHGSSSLSIVIAVLGVVCACRPVPAKPDDETCVESPIVSGAINPNAEAVVHGQPAVREDTEVSGLVVSGSVVTPTGVGSTIYTASGRIVGCTLSASFEAQVVGRCGGGGGRVSPHWQVVLKRRDMPVDLHISGSESMEDCWYYSGESGVPDPMKPSMSRVVGPNVTRVAIKCVTTRSPPCDGVGDGVEVSARVKYDWKIEVAVARPKQKRCDMHPRLKDDLDKVLASGKGLAAYRQAKVKSSHADSEFDAMDLGGADCQGTLAGAVPVGAILRGGSQHCTGALIAPTVVLTAAHCIHAFDPSTLSFEIESADGKWSKGVEVESGRSHKLYVPTEMGRNDIGVLYLSRPVAGREPFDYRREPANERSSISAVAIGHGSLGSMKPGRRRCLGVPVSEVCERAFTQAAPDRHLCRGDSGGPIVELVDGRYRILGITSWGDDMCSDFSVGMDVGAYSADIEAWVRAAPKPTE